MKTRVTIGWTWIQKATKEFLCKECVFESLADAREWFEESVHDLSVYECELVELVAER